MCLNSFHFTVQAAREMTTSFVFKSRDESQQMILRASQATVSNLARTFLIDHTSLYIVDQRSGCTEFPTSGIFELEDYVSGTIFIVHGDRSGGTVTISNLFQPPSQSVLLTPSSQTTTMPTPRLSTGISRNALVIVKVVRADLSENGKPVNMHKYNLTTFVPLYAEEQATVNYIISQVREKMRDDSLELVGASGLKFYHEEGTRGVAFWKVGSRKIFAVTGEDIERQKVCNSLDDADDFYTPLARKRKNDDFEDMKMDIKKLKDSADKIFKICSKKQFNVAFLNSLEETFACVICKASPVNPPIIFCRACSSLVGCNTCVNTWYSGSDGLDKPCPKCREPRGLSSTFVVKGFHDFLKEMNNLLSADTGDESDASADTLPIAFD